MGNKVSLTINPLNYVKNSQNETLHELYNELKSDLTDKLTNEKKSNKEKFDTICLYSNIRDVLFTDAKNTKNEIELLVNEYTKLYDLTKSQLNLIDQIYENLCIEY